MSLVTVIVLGVLAWIVAAVAAAAAFHLVHSRATAHDRGQQPTWEEISACSQFILNRPGAAGKVTVPVSGHNTVLLDLDREEAFRQTPNGQSVRLFWRPISEWLPSKDDQ